jgi:hypothetical protein
MFLLVGIQVIPIQVKTQCVGSVVATRNTIRINHWYELEDKEPSQQTSPWIITKQKRKKTKETILSRRLSGMYAAGDKNNLPSWEDFWPVSD